MGDRPLERLHDMGIVVDPHSHIRVLHSVSRFWKVPGEQVGQIQGAGVRGALGDAEKEITVAGYPGTMPSL